MLVERDELIGELAAAMDDALDGRGRLFFIGGEAGVGKSTLVRALADLMKDRCTIRVGGADNVTTAEALAPFQEAVPEILPRLAAGGTVSGCSVRSARLSSQSRACWCSRTCIGRMRRPSTRCDSSAGGSRAPRS